MRLVVLLAALLAAGSAYAQRLPGPIPARVLSVYDGDTITVEAEIWPGHFVRSGVRVDGLDTPEIRGECEWEKQAARAARDRLKAILRAATAVTLTAIRKGKYAGRVVARVHADGADVAAILIQESHARPYDGGKRAGWCEGRGPAVTGEAARDQL